MGGPLTLQVLSGPRQEVVEDVEGPFFLGLTDSAGLFQEILADVKEPPWFPLSALKRKAKHGMLPRLHPGVGASGSLVSFKGP